MKTSGTGLTAKAKVIIAAAAAAVVTAGIVAGVLLTRQDTYRVLKVFELMGTASVTRESAGDLDAYVGMNLESGDVVSVDDGSNMRISLDSDKYVLLDSGTVLELVATGSEKDSRTSLNLREGAILNEITSALSENSSYEVNAPKATMAVRGTSYSVTVTKEGDKYIIELNTFHGRVGVRLISEDGTPGEEVMVGEGKSVLIITEPNENTHNSPDIDGHSYFVIRDPEAEGGYRKVDISEAVFDSEYDFLAASIKERVIKSNSSGLFQIKDAIIEKLTGGAPDSTDGTTAASSYKPMGGGTGTSASVTQASAKPVQTSAPAQSSVTSTATAPNVPVNSDNYTSAPVFTESTNGGGTSSGNDNAPRITGEAESAFISGTRTSGTETENSAFVSGSGVTAPENSDTSGTRRSETSGRETYPRTTGQGTSTSPYVTNPNVTDDTSGSGFSPLVTTRTTGTGSQTSFTTRPAVTTKPATSTTTSSSSADEPEVYTVTFTDEGGLILYTRQVEEGDTVSSFPQVPAKTGCTGVWLVKGSNVQFTAATPVTSDMTVYASYSLKEYTITLIYSDTEMKITAKYGELLSSVLPAVPEKAGHDGIWTLGGAAIDASEKVTEDITVVAKYTPKTYTITMNVEGNITTMNAKYGDILADILPAVPQKTGYDGIWTVVGTAVSDTFKVTGDVTVTARYTVKSYTITMNVEGTTSTIDANYGDVLADILPAVPEKTGHDGIWTIGGTAVTNQKVTGNMTVTAKYTPKTYTVTMNVEGTTSTINAKYGDALADILPAVPEKAGHDGIWTVGGAAVTTQKVTGNMTVSAKYTPKTYTITMSVDGTTSTIDANYGDILADILPAVPEKAGHDGIWTLGGAAIDASEKVTEDITVVAKYTPKTYTITMNVEGTTSTINAKYGDALADILPDVPEKAGHDGIWTVGGAAVTTQKVTGNMTVSAKYTPKIYTVTIIIGSERDTKTAEYGTLLEDILPELPEKNGYNAVWTVDGEPVVIGAMVTEDITVTAKYTQKEFTVSYTDKNGTGAETYADSGEKLLDVLADPEVGNELDLKYTWLTRNNAWDPAGHSGMVKVNDSHVITKDIGSAYEVKAAAKNEITYYIGDDINGYTAAGSFWLMTNEVNETISDVQPGYLTTILPAGYTGFAYTTDYGSYGFDEYDTAYGVNAIYTYNYILTFVNNNYDYTTKFFPTGKTVGDLGSLPALSDPANNVWAYYKDGWQELTADTQVTEDMNISEVSKSEVIFHTVSYTRADGTSGSIQVGEGKKLYEALTAGGLTPAEGYSWVDAGENTVTAETLCTGDMTITEKGNLVTLEFYYNGTMYKTENVRVGDKVSLTADMLIGSTGAPFSSLDAFGSDANVWKFTVGGTEYYVGGIITITGDTTVTVTME